MKLTANKDQFALITGGSKGIGKEIAIEFARLKYNLILISRSLPELAVVAKEIERDYSVTVKYYAIDLSNSLAPKFVYEMVLAEQAKISVLVNNAGYGLYGNFSELPLTGQVAMLQVNVLSLVSLTYELLPLLKKNKEAYILNLSSIAAFHSIPGFSLYAASKSFVLSFSRSLRLEEKKNNVFVSCVCPGAVKTNFMNRANILKQDRFSYAWKSGLTASQVAKISVKGMFRKKAEIIPGFANQLSTIVFNFLPKTIIEKITSSILK